MRIGIFYLWLWYSSIIKYFNFISLLCSDIIYINGKMVEDYLGFGLVDVVRVRFLRLF